MLPLFRAAAVAVVVLLASGSSAADKRPLKLDDMFAFKRVAAPQISLDGKQVVYQLTTVSLKDNASTTALWLAAADGKTPSKQLLGPKGKKDTNPRWSPDGRQNLFEANRSGTGQLWVVSPDGG